MGWKTLKEHYRIGHIVQVTSKGICIGSPYIHDLIVVTPDGKVVKDSCGSNADLERYLAEMQADPDKLREVVQAQDVFTASIPVYTYEGGSIIKKRCEELGWPNCTHDGLLMYENTFSADKEQVVRWAKRNAAAGIRLLEERVSELFETLEEAEADLDKRRRYVAKLNADYPDVVVEVSDE